jgi:hypothetical protein
MNMRAEPFNLPPADRSKSDLVAKPRPTFSAFFAWFASLSPAGLCWQQRE